MVVLDTSCPADHARVAGLMDGLLQLARGSTVDGELDDGWVANEFRRLSGGDYRLAVVCTRTAGVDEAGAWGGGVVGAAVAAPGRAVEVRAGCGKVTSSGMRALLVQDEMRGKGVARDMLSVLQEVLRGRCGQCEAGYVLQAVTDTCVRTRGSGLYARLGWVALGPGGAGGELGGWEWYGDVNVVVRGDSEPAAKRSHRQRQWLDLDGGPGGAEMDDESAAGAGPEGAGQAVTAEPVVAVRPAAVFEPHKSSEHFQKRRHLIQHVCTQHTHAF